MLKRSRDSVLYGLVPAMRWSEGKLPSVWRMLVDSSATTKGHIKSIISHILAQGTKSSPGGPGAEIQSRGNAAARTVSRRYRIGTAQRFFKITLGWQPGGVAPQQAVTATWFVQWWLLAIEATGALWHAMLAHPRSHPVSRIHS